MSKAVAGAAELVGAVGMGVAAAFDPALIASPWFDKIWAGLVLSGIGNVAGAIADTIAGNRSMQITTRQPAAPRTIVYGTQMIGGVEVFRSFTGHQNNILIVLAAHQIEAIDALFLDGRKVIFQNGGFGGDASNSDQIGPDGVTHYNFGGKVSCFYRLGDQQFGDYMQELHGNDPSWGPSANGDVPSLTGCSYVYVKLTQSSSQFPSEPEIKFIVRGKNDIYDPRTGTRGFTNNAALVLADVISDSEFGLGDSSINTAQLIAAANICDEQVAVAALNGQTESRYCCDWAYDTATSVADTLQTMLTGMAGRWSFIGGEHFIFPGAYTAPSTSMDISDITAAFDWKPNRSIRDLPNRVSATHVSPSWPWSTAGDFYQNRQTVENSFDMKFTQTSVPDYAQDQLHGYPNDEWLTQDGNHQRPLNLNLPTVLSVTQAQRVMKINLMRQRKYQGSGSIELKLWNYKLQPCDTTQFTFSQLGWNNRVMEVSGTSLRVDRGDNEVPVIRFSLSLQETGPDVYAWSSIEELTVYSAPASPTQTPWTPNPPTNMQLSSGPQTAIVSQDGIATPVIQVTWDTPLDNAATGIAIQYRETGTTTWYSAPTTDISLNVGLISTVVAGKNYDVRIATVRANGALSEWVEQDNFLVPLLDSFLGTLSSQIQGGGWVGKWWRISSGNIPYGGGELSTPTLFQTQGSIVSISGGNGEIALTRQTIIPAASDGAGTDWLYARFTCNFVAPATGTYTFGANSDDGARVVVNNVELFSQLGNVNGITADLSYTWSGTIDLTAGTSYPIVVEWVNQQGGAGLQALYTPPGASSPKLLDLGATYRDAGSVTYSNGQTAQDLQGNAAAGASENLIPNGNFVLGSIQGWTDHNGATPVGWSLGSDSYGQRVYSAPNNPTGGLGLVSPTFSVIPGQKYKITFRDYSANGAGGIWYRIYFSANYTKNICANTPAHDSYDFLANWYISSPGPRSDPFDWTCPDGVHYASLAVYNTGNGDLSVQYLSCVPYAGVAQWGADVTGQNTSNDTSFVSGVPSGTIANVIPNGYRLYINSGSRSYSIQAI